MNEVVKQTGFFRSFDDTSIYYESRGEGEAVVLIYGIACLMNHWHHQVDFLAKKYRVITFDLRGHHKSEAPKGNQNLKIEDISKDLLHLLKFLEIEKAHFVGHSFGVPILIQFSKDNADKISSFSFINGFAKNPVKGMFGVDLIEPFYHFVKAQHDSNPIFWEKFWKNATNNPVTMWVTGLAGGFNLKLTQFKDIEVYAKGVSVLSLSVFLPMFESLMQFDGDSLLKKIAAPTLIISGEKDAVTPIKFQEQLHQQIKSSVFVVVPYGSHCTQLDFPDYVNLKLDSHFLNSSGSTYRK